MCRTNKPLFLRLDGSLREFCQAMVKLVLLLGTSLLLSAQTSDYEGPSILSRGGPASSMGRTPDVSFRPYVGVSAIYDTSFTGVVTNSAGRLQSLDSIGLQGSAGVYGVHHFKRGILGLSYSGEYQHYAHNPYADGINQMLTLYTSHRLSRYLSFSLSEAAGTYTRNYLYTSGGGLFDPQALNLPTNDLFDNRVFYGETVGSLTYRANARLSFNMSGAGYLVRRRSSSLYGVTGYSASADAAYRVTRFVTLAAVYGFQHFDFTKAFGASDIHMAGLVLSARLSRSMELDIEAGGARVETLFLATVPIDPVIAAITGQTLGIRATYNVLYVPTGRIRLTKQMQRATAELSYAREISAGNGVYLTSRSESVGLGYSYSGLRHWNVGANAGYARLVALAQSVGTYEGYQAGAGVTRDLGHGLQFVFRADGRRAATNYANFNRNAVALTLGFFWSPGDIPLSLW